MKHTALALFALALAGAAYADSSGNGLNGQPDDYANQSYQNSISSMPNVGGYSQAPSINAPYPPSPRTDPWYWKSLEENNHEQHR